MDSFKGIVIILLTITVLRRQKVLARPALGRSSRATSSQCSPVTSLKKDYTNKIKMMLNRMASLFFLVEDEKKKRKYKPSQPSISFPPSYVKSIGTKNMTMDKLNAYFMEMDKYTTYLDTQKLSVFHKNLLQSIKNVGNSVQKYCNCPSSPTGKQYFVSSHTGGSVPGKKLSNAKMSYVLYKIQTSLRHIKENHNRDKSIKCQ